MSQPFPQARFDGLVTTEAADDLLIYDGGRHELHTLNQVAVSVWRAADGSRSVADLALVTGLDLPTVELALDQLATANLLINAPAARTTSGRRRFLKQAGVTGAVIASVSVPMAAAAFSCPAGVTPITVDLCAERGDGTICWTGVPGTGNPCGCCKSPGQSGNWVCSMDC